MSPRSSGPQGASPSLERINAELRRQARMGLALCVLLVGGVGGWAATATIAGAVIAPGLVVVDSNSKKVQHPTGGVVGVIKVRLGDRVRAGDLLVRLDETQLRATLGVIQSQLVQSLARRARLEAERDEAPDMQLPAGFEASGEEAGAAAAGERRLFASRRASARGQKEQHRERVRQLEQEIQGLSAQLGAKESETDLQMREISRLEGLYDQKLVNETRMSQLKRDMVKLEGEVGSLTAQIARTKAQISQIELQILQIDHDARAEAQKDLREVEARIAELSERRIAAVDQLRRVDIRAPIDGVVHELSLHTIGGVIQPGETLMLIVPSGEPLAIEARISPAEIDQVAVGRRAVLRFTAFNQRTTPEVGGTVTHVAADVSRDAQSGQTYFLVRIRMDEAAAGELQGQRIGPGLPVEGFIETEARTALSYIVKPMVDNLRRTFRER